jgi:hypothetical protein
MNPILSFGPRYRIKAGECEKVGSLLYRTRFCGPSLHKYVLIGDCNQLDARLMASGQETATLALIYLLLTLDLFIWTSASHHYRQPRRINVNTLRDGFESAK